MKYKQHTAHPHTVHFRISFTSYFARLSAYLITNMNNIAFLFMQPQPSNWCMRRRNMHCEWHFRRSYYRLKLKHDYKKAQKHLLLSYVCKPAHPMYVRVQFFVHVCCGCRIILILTYCKHAHIHLCTGMVSERECLNEFSFNDIEIIIVIRLLLFG